MTCVCVLTGMLFTLPFTLPTAPPPVFPEPRTKVPEGDPKGNQPLPRGYRGYTFGLTRMQVLEKVRKDPRLRAYDADFIEGFEQENWTVLVTVGLPWFSEVFFLFYKKTLYGVVLVFDRKRYSYYEVLKSLKARYGAPTSLGQQSSVWQDKQVRLQLENTVTLKYLDIQTFQKIKKEFQPELLRKRPRKQKALDNL